MTTKTKRHDLRFPYQPHLYKLYSMGASQKRQPCRTHNGTGTTHSNCIRKHSCSHNAPVLVRRKPRLLLRLLGQLLLRLATRRLAALLFQLPPRNTRLEPSSLCATVYPSYQSPKNTPLPQKTPSPTSLPQEKGKKTKSKS